MFKNIDLSTVVALNSNTLTMVLACTLATVLMLIFTKKSVKTKRMHQSPPPGPKQYPIIGSLAALRGYEAPYQALNALAEKYGPVTSIRLGSVPAVLVSDIESFKEVLLTKWSQFDGRPNFFRFNLLCTGKNRQNCEYFAYELF